MLSLLDKAKRIATRKRKAYPQEELDLLQGWLDDEVSPNQIAAALGYRSNGAIYHFLATRAKALYIKNGVK